MTITDIDRTIFELLRLELVAGGNLPDITTLSAKEDYQAAKDAIESDETKELIDCMGVGPMDGKIGIRMNRINISREGKTVGATGGFPSIEFDLVSGVEGEGSAVYNKLFLPDSSRDIDYEIRIYCNKISSERIISSIIDRILGARRHLFIFDETVFSTDPNDAFLIELTNEVDIDSTELIEKVYKYRVVDVFITEHRQVPGTGDIPAVADIQTDIIPEINE